MMKVLLDFIKIQIQKMETGPDSGFTLPQQGDNQNDLRSLSGDMSRVFSELAQVTTEELKRPPGQSHSKRAQPLSRS